MKLPEPAGTVWRQHRETLHEHARNETPPSRLMLGEARSWQPDSATGKAATSTSLSARIDETNTRIDDPNRRFENRFESLTSEMHQRFDRVHQELAENRERMAKLEGSLDGFLAGRRDRDAA